MELNIAIVGAGIVGLSTAKVLLNRGHRVSVYTKDNLESTTSMKAAAIWFPFKAEPWQKVVKWSKRSLDYYRQYQHDPRSGVKWVQFWVLDTVSQAKKWIEAVPNEEYKILDTRELPPGYKHGYLVNVPMIDTSLFLPYLFNEVSGRAKIFQQKISHFSEITSQYDWIVNCTGLEAAHLTEDKKLFPIQGQIVKIKKEPDIRYMADDYGPNALAYIIPRHDCIVLGGTALNHATDLRPDPTETQRIIERCRTMHPGLKGEILESYIGLRPGREEVRIEIDTDQPIIHHYGHGGSGYTICWGCAEEVANLIGH